MKISKETINILRNYSSINSNLLLRPGSKISTISANKTIASNVTVPEEFPSEYGIYDLNAFLGALSLFEDPDLTFEDKYVIMQDRGNIIKYYAAESTVLTVPKNDIKFPSANIEFDITGDMISSVLRTAGVLKSTDLTVIGDGTNLILIVGDKKNVTGNTFETVVGTTDKTFKAYIKIENLKMLHTDYTVTIHPSISRFQSHTGDLVYYLAVESDSSF